MSILDKAEAKFGRFAISSILKIIAGFQILVYVLLAFTSLGTSIGDSPFYGYLVLDRESLLSGQIWRLVTFMFLPAAENPIWLMVFAYFIYFIGEGLEEAWGAFRLNVFVFLGIAFVAIGVVFLGGVPTGHFLFSTFILAFAMLYPNKEIMLMFIIPIKMKWVGLLTLGMMMFEFIDKPLPFKVTIFLSMLAFLLFFGPSVFRNLKTKSQNAERRRKFEVGLPDENEAFYTCSVCGKTDLDDPEESFRVAADEQEYCSSCRSLGDS